MSPQLCVDEITPLSKCFPQWHACGAFPANVHRHTEFLDCSYGNRQASHYDPQRNAAHWWINHQRRQEQWTCPLCTEVTSRRMVSNHWWKDCARKVSETQSVGDIGGVCLIRRSMRYIFITYAYTHFPCRLIILNWDKTSIKKIKQMQVLVWRWWWLRKSQDRRTQSKLGSSYQLGRRIDRMHFTTEPTNLPVIFEKDMFLQNAYNF